APAAAEETYAIHAQVFGGSVRRISENNKVTGRCVGLVTALPSPRFQIGRHCESALPKQFSVRVESPNPRLLVEWPTPCLAPTWHRLRNLKTERCSLQPNTHP